MGFAASTKDLRVDGIANFLGEMQGRLPMGPLDGLEVSDLSDLSGMKTEDDGKTRGSRNRALLTAALFRDATRALSNGRYLRAAGMSLSSRRLYEGGKAIIIGDVK